MNFRHPLVNKSWVTYEINKNGTVAMILHVELNKIIQPGTKIEAELADAIVEFMKKHDGIDRTEVLPRNRQ
jgi:hypothetical protein